MKIFRRHCERSEAIQRRYARKDAKINPYILSLLLFISIPLLGHTEALYPLSNQKQEAQFKGLLRELRCLVCQNQDLADSNAPLAKDLRDEVYNLVQTGKSDDEIVRYLTARYGDFILFKPPVKSMHSINGCNTRSMFTVNEFIYVVIFNGLICFSCYANNSTSLNIIHMFQSN